MTEKSISSELNDILSRLSVDQRRYVVARMDYPTKNDAAKAIGMKPDTVYRWPPDVERAVELLSQDIITGAKQIRARSLAKAMLVKVKGLDSNDERLRQNVASEIIEWELGKAQQALDVTSGGEKLPAPKVDDEKFNRAIESLAKAIGAAIPNADDGEASRMDTAE